MPRGGLAAILNLEVNGDLRSSADMQDSPRIVVSKGFSGSIGIHIGSQLPLGDAISTANEPFSGIPKPYRSDEQSTGKKGHPESEKANRLANPRPSAPPLGIFAILGGLIGTVGTIALCELMDYGRRKPYRRDCDGMKFSVRRQMPQRYAITCIPSKMER